jgi:UDP-N-acetyl-D-mannosaminuronic acid dehydrogenase
MKVCVVGLGYIGLPTALMLAANGQEVAGVDRNPAVVASLNAGRVTFEEKGLTELYAQAVARGIRFTAACEPAEIYIVAVATPYDPATKKVDAGYVTGAVENVLDACADGAILVVESTVSPGTIDRCVRPLIAARGRDVHLPHAPERIIPGNMLYELVHNARTVGADDPQAAQAVRDMYASFCRGQIVLTDIRTAEMSKVVENTFRDVNIAFANELAKICREGGMDVYEIIRIANLHPRVNILSPGPGVGGHCISVDPWFLAGDYPQEAKLIRAAREINDGMPAFTLDRTLAVMAENGLRDFGRVGLYGLTYKENVDDTRESPTLRYLAAARERGLPPPQTYDPFVKTVITDNQHLSLASFLAACDLAVVMVGHDQLRCEPSLLGGKIVLDTRHLPGLEGAYRL